MSATMAKTLAEVAGTASRPSRGAETNAPCRPTPAPASAPAPAPAPAPSPSADDEVIYVCPDGFTETPRACARKTQYTFHHDSAYTFHRNRSTRPASLDTFNETV